MLSEALKSELRSELLSELNSKISELKGELLSELSKIRNNDDLLVSDSLSERLRQRFDERLTIAQLSERFGCDSSLVRKQKSKYKDEAEKFIAWSKTRDPEGRVKGSLRRSQSLTPLTTARRSAELPNRGMG